MVPRFRSIMGALVLAGAVAACDQPLSPDDQQANFASGSGSGTEVELRAVLTGAGGEGKARFRAKDEGELNLRIEVEDAQPGTLVHFFVAGHFLGSRTVDVGGNARVDLNTDDGDHVPNVGPGTHVQVHGAVVHLHGTF